MVSEVHVLLTSACDVSQLIHYNCSRIKSPKLTAILVLLCWQREYAPLNQILYANAVMQYNVRQEDLFSIFFASSFFFGVFAIEPLTKTWFSKLTF